MRVTQRAPYFESVKKVDIIVVCVSFRLVRNRSNGFKEGFPARFTCGNDSLFCNSISYTIWYTRNPADKPEDVISQYPFDLVEGLFYYVRLRQERCPEINTILLPAKP